MILTLEVADPESKHPPRRARLRASGGTIGRGPACTLVLSDQHVSGQHAIIHYSNGTFFVEDCSTNGVYLDSLRNRLPRAERVPLRSGSVLLIDPYEIRVHIEAEHAPAPGAESRGPVLAERDLASPPGEGLLPGDFLLPDTPARPNDLLGSLDVSTPGVPAPQVQLIPPDWHREHIEPVLQPAAPPVPAAVPMQPAREPAVPAAMPPEHFDDALLAAVLTGAGLSRSDVTPELAQNLGRILRVVVAGVMDVLAARQRTKEEFRVGVTTFKRSGNNPLKFSTTVEDALHNLLVKRLDGYLGPVEAFEDAFEDLRHHQVATLHGVRQAFESMLSRFDPERLQAEFDSHQKGALVAMPAALRSWNLYRDWFHGMVGDVDASFRELFGNEFAEAYEEQLKRLKAQGRSGASHRDEDGR